MIWTSSGDSHFMEPDDLYRQHLPVAVAERLPWTEPDGDGFELVHIDGRTTRRRQLGPAQQEVRRLIRAPGATDPARRLEDLDEQGVWAEVVYPSLGLWYNDITDPDLVTQAARVLNDHLLESFAISPRFVPVASLPLQSVEESVIELRRVAALGYKAVFLPTGPPAGTPSWNHPEWEPIWTEAEQAGLVVAVHIGTDGGSPTKFKGPGGAIINYVETTFGGQRTVTQLIAGGVLERHPQLRVLVSEGGATWAPFLGDRMNEVYRQEPMFRDGKITRDPKEYLSQVYATFQHDVTAVPTVTAMGFDNVLFGTDYPHLEGTFPKTQEVLAGLFEGVDEEVRERITMGAFLELFPHTGRPPAMSA